MQSLLAAGSAIGQRMLGMITRSPRVLLSPQQQALPRPTHSHHAETFPDFNNCDCHFGKRKRERERTVMIAAVISGGENLQPYTTDLESYGAPAAPLVTLPQSER